LNLELAFCCPPLGLNIFISSFRFNRPVVSLYKIVLPFVAILAGSLLLVTYIPRISNVLVLGDIDKKREDAIKLGQPPRDAWLLECVQADRSNPLPCTEEESKKYPNGQIALPAPTTTVEVRPISKEGGADDDDDLAAIEGKPKEAGAPAPSATNESDEDDLAAIEGKPKDAGAGTAPAVADAGTAAAVDAAALGTPKKHAPRDDSDDEILKEIQGH
jgi:C4-dicarboxylate transporter, DctM subunit